MFDLKSFNYSINDLFLEEKILNTEKYKCKSCNEIIYQKEMYQCKEGDCINCKQCWEKLILEKENLTCGVISFQDLSRSKTLENSFNNKCIYCPFTFYNIDENKVKDDNGCLKIIKVHELESHKASCVHRFVKCENKSEDGVGNCNFSMRFNKLEEHQNKCPLQILKCELCNKEMIRSVFENHNELCPSFIVECNQCQTEVERQYLEDHIDKICGQTLIPCKYKDYGCNSFVKRSSLGNHLDFTKHGLYISNIIEKHTIILEGYEKLFQLHNENFQKLCVKVWENEDELNQNKEQIQIQNQNIDLLRKKLEESEKKLIQTQNQNIYTLSKFLQDSENKLNQQNKEQFEIEKKNIESLFNLINKKIDLKNQNK